MHGADLTNSLWMPAGSLLVEVTQKRHCEGLKSYMWQEITPVLELQTSRMLYDAVENGNVFDE
jgi:hypothetical protein